MILGFPESLGEWGPKDYLRLVVIIGSYLILRPLIQQLMTKMGERRRLREKKAAQEESARRFQQARVQEKLGIDSKSSTTATKAAASATDKLRNRKGLTKGPADDMPSDEDVSDLIS